MKANSKNIPSIIIYLIAILMLLSIPLIIKDPYFVHIIIMIMIYICLSLSLNLIMITGLISIAHAAFMGIGAYTSTLLMMKIQVPFWLALPLAGLAAAILSLFLGLFTLRMKGIYFALATFAFNEIFRMILIGWVNVFGGANGISDIPPPHPISLAGLFDVEFSSKVNYFYIPAGYMILTVFFITRLFRSRIGLVLRSIEEADILTESAGINTMKFKMFAFITSSFIAGISGSIYAHYFSYICPNDFSFWESVAIIVFTVIGGVGSIIGPMLATCLLTVIPELLRFAVEYQTLIYGCVLILALLFMPQGIIGLLQRMPFRYIFKSNVY